MMRESGMIAAFIMVMPMTSVTKYVNDVHGNTVQIYKSSEFHILELSGMTPGIMSSIFIGGIMLFCVAYFAYEIGLGKILGCCCRCPEDKDGQRVSAGGMITPQIKMTQSLPMITQQQPQQQVATLQGVVQYGTLDLPKILTLKVQYVFSRTDKG